MLFMRKTTALPSAAEALPGRAKPLPTATSHFVNGHRLQPPYPQGLEQAVFGLGCFWGAERKFWELGDGVYTTAVGYAGGHTPNPTYEEVCSGRTGHTEVGAGGVRSEEDLLRAAAEDVLGESRPDPGHAPGQRRRHPVPFGDLHLQRRAAQSRRGVEGGVSEGACRRRASAPITTEIVAAPARSISPRTITSNIWPRIRPAIAGSAAPACRARSAPASTPDRFLHLSPAEVQGVRERSPHENPLLTIIGARLERYPV